MHRPGGAANHRRPFAIATAVTAIIGVIAIMDLSSDLALSFLFIAVIANMAILAMLVASGRLRRPGEAPVDRAAVDQALSSSSSFSTHSARGGWDRRADSRGNDGNNGSDAGVPVGALVAASAADPDPAGQAPAIMSPDSAFEVESPEATFERVPVQEAAPTVEVLPGADAAPAALVAPDAGGGTAWRRDDLTGLIDAETFARLVADEDARVRRYERAATIVVFELDGLDRLVERLGDDAGDRIIAALADTVLRLARNADHVARLSSGRFGVLLTETDDVQAINYIERVRRACELWLDSGAIALRLVTGWAGASRELTLLDAQRLATERMYTELRRGARRGEGSEPSMERAAS
ncbi:MAG TPA: diguanylate cyclase [Candidatus Saccharimonadales bacterium]|nr:diguanylate cyclase [Candidatus Saccharimonadales bacterium]